ncbi:MAG: hypothetical protein AUF79_10330 [Crenarchaeota archaeon 13_1_20CM_2_51_8]|jgi:hypothetical protein|nr:MAG: hypothetical protein AUF79_10330 [Crenarchaeota archaeon 13_1_20CM_2_51_8]
MSEHSEPHESLHLTVVQESAKNYQSFLNKKKNLTEKRSIISTLRKLFSEELEPNKQHPHSADTAGFN